MGAAFLQGGAALGTGWRMHVRRLLPGSGRALEGEIFEHACARMTQAGIQFEFNLTQRCGRMLGAPFAHTPHDILGHMPPQRFIHDPCHHILLSRPGICVERTTDATAQQPMQKRATHPEHYGDTRC